MADIVVDSFVDLGVKCIPDTDSAKWQGGEKEDAKEEAKEEEDEDEEQGESKKLVQDDQEEEAKTKKEQEEEKEEEDVANEEEEGNKSETKKLVHEDQEEKEARQKKGHEEEKEEEDVANEEEEGNKSETKKLVQGDQEKKKAKTKKGQEEEKEQEQEKQEEQEHEKEQEDPESEPSMTGRRIYRNVFVLSFVFLTTMMSFQGLEALQSSLHLVSGMGTTTLGVLYAVRAVACLFLPQLATQKLGHKRTISLCILGYISWEATNGYAVWWSLVPASVLVGLCSGPLWAAASAYITIMAEQYAKLTHGSLETILPKLFGIFYGCVNSAGLFSNIISATVLQQAPPENYTTPSEEDLALCGINDCPGNNVSGNANLEKPAESLVWTLVGIYIAIALTGLVLSVTCLDAIPKEFLAHRVVSCLKDDLQATARQLMKPRQLFLIPLPLYLGMSQAFRSSGWNKSFLTCNIGIWMIGYTNIAYYAAYGITPFLAGNIIKFTGRRAVFLFAMLADLALYLTYIFWRPNPAQPALFFILPLINGISMGIWSSQIYAFHGFVFGANKEAAFSSVILATSSGACLGFVISSYMCTIQLLYILIICLVLGVLGYLIVDWGIRRKTKSKQDNKL